MIRLRERGATFAVAAVLAAGALLTMHVYTAHSHTATSHHSASLSTLTNSVAPAGSSDHSTSGHSSHDLVECCFWLLLTGLVLLVALRSSRLRLLSQVAPALVGMGTATSQRAPPITTRLSLVGVSRR